MSRKRTDRRRQGRERDRARRPRTISISLERRGQTTQDFAVGIGVFLLSLAFVFSFLPSIVTPFDSSVGGAETAQADRIADQIVHNLSASNEHANNITKSDFEDTYAEENLSAEVGLRASSSDDVVYDRVNVTIETFQGDIVSSSSPDLTGGDTYDNQSAASSARIVTVVDSDGDKLSKCDPACRLVVRVW